jgi:hypothetical protein
MWQRTEEHIAMDLTVTTPLLVELELKNVELAPEFWEALSRHPHLRTLLLLEIRIEAVEAPVFWETCVKLDILDMTRVVVQGGIPKDMVLNRLRELVLRSFGQDVRSDPMDLILQSPLLKNLKWCNNSFDNTTKGRPLFQYPVKKSHWPRLGTLILREGLQDTEMASLLGGIGNGHEGLTQLKLKVCQLGPLALKALGLHFSTLVDLVLDKCDSATSSMIRDVLCSCPSLKTLSARSISAKDIAQGGPWVCQQLWRLFICFHIGESEKDLQPFVFERLSTLVQLEQLYLWLPLGRNKGVLEFRLGCGLNQLAALKQLTRVCFIGGRLGEYMPHIGVEEVAWMVDHWKNLKVLTGNLNKDSALGDQLRTAIESYGISTV